MEKHITTTDQEKNMGMFAHLGTFLGYFFPFANIFVPLIIWLSNKESDYIRKHGKSVLNFQISLFLYYLITGVLFLIFFLRNILELGIHQEALEEVISRNSAILFESSSIIALLLLVLFYSFLQILNIITTIIGGIKASKGEYYKYPLSIRFIR